MNGIYVMRIWDRRSLKLVIETTYTDLNLALKQLRAWTTSSPLAKHWFRAEIRDTVDDTLLDLDAIAEE